VSGLTRQVLNGIPAIGWGGAYNGTGQGQFAARHNGGICYIFFDGHAKWLTVDESFKLAPNGKYYYFARTQSS
jgi:prepilin-type processing-associated H-X9-DG protein